MSANPPPPAQATANQPNPPQTAPQQPQVQTDLEPNRHNVSIRLGREDYRLLRTRLLREQRIEAFYRSWRGRLAKAWEENAGVAWTLGAAFLVTAVAWLIQNLGIEYGPGEALSPWLTACILRNSQPAMYPSCTLHREDFIQLREAAHKFLILEDYSTYMSDLAMEAREVATDMSQMADIGNYFGHHHFNQSLTNNDTLWESYLELSGECRGLIGTQKVTRDELRSDFAVIRKNIDELHHWLRDVVELQGRPSLNAALEAARSACWLQDRTSPFDLRGWEHALRCWAHDQLKRRLSARLRWATSIQDRRQRIRSFTALVRQAEHNATQTTLQHSGQLADNRESAIRVLAGAHRAVEGVGLGPPVGPGAGTDFSDGRTDHVDCFFFIDRIPDGARLVSHTDQMPYPGNDPARARAAVAAAVRLYTRQAVAFDRWLAEAHRRGRAPADAYLDADESGMMPRWYTEMLERDRREEAARSRRTEARARMTSLLEGDRPATETGTWIGPSTWAWYSAMGY